MNECVIEKVEVASIVEKMVRFWLTWFELVWGGFVESFY